MSPFQTNWVSAKRILEKLGIDIYELDILIREHALPVYDRNFGLQKPPIFEEVPNPNHDPMALFSSETIVTKNNLYDFQETIRSPL
jgi:hypothetical protein